MSKKQAIKELVATQQEIYMAARAPKNVSIDKLMVSAATGLAVAATEIADMSPARTPSTWQQRITTLAMIAEAQSLLMRASARPTLAAKQTILEAARGSTEDALQALDAPFW